MWVLWRVSFLYNLCDDSTHSRFCNYTWYCLCFRHSCPVNLKSKYKIENVRAFCRNMNDRKQFLFIISLCTLFYNFNCEFLRNFDRNRSMFLSQWICHLHYANKRIVSIVLNKFKGIYNIMYSTLFRFSRSCRRRLRDVNFNKYRRDLLAGILIIEIRKIFMPEKLFFMLL